MSRKLFAIISFSLLFASAAQAQQVHVDETVQYYEIFGRRGDDLLEEMQKKSPPSQFGGNRYFARAEFYYRWELSNDYWARPCKIDSFDVTVEIKYTFPLWRERERASARLIDYWEKFIDAVWVHEKGHGDIAVQTGVELAKAIGEISKELECEKFADEAKRISKEILDSSGEQAIYDRETKHGKTQGATFDVGAIPRHRIRKKKNN